MGVLEGILSYSFEINLESCRKHISVAAKNNKLGQIAVLHWSLTYSSEYVNLNVLVVSNNLIVHNFITY